MVYLDRRIFCLEKGMYYRGNVSPQMKRMWYEFRLDSANIVKSRTLLLSMTWLQSYLLILTEI